MSSKQGSRSVLPSQICPFLWLSDVWRRREMAVSHSGRTEHRPLGHKKTSRSRCTYSRSLDFNWEVKEGRDLREQQVYSSPSQFTDGHTVPRGRELLVFVAEMGREIHVLQYLKVPQTLLQLIFTLCGESQMQKLQKWSPVSKSFFVK